MRKFIFAALFITILAFPQAAKARSAGVENEYLRAKSCYGEVRVTPAKAKRHGEWQRCIDLFENIHKKYPQSEQGPQALYNVGKLYSEAWAKLGRKGDAESSIRAFNMLVREYPKNSLADDALFQIGQLRKKPMGQYDRAKVAFEYIVENYPYGDMRDKAKRELLAMEEKNAAPASNDLISGEPGREKLAAAGAGELEVESVGLPTAAPGAGKVGSGDKASPGETAATEKTPPIPPAGKAKSGGATAGPKNPATLEAIEIVNDDSETSVSLKLSRRAPYSVEFTEMGVRTKSPPRLDMLLLYTKSGTGLSRDIQVKSRHLARIKLKRALLEGGILLQFELSPDASYAISSKNDLITVRFKRGEARRGTPHPVRSPPQRARSSSRGKPFVVVIDPGHGGSDPGAIGPGGTKEKDVALALSRKLSAAAGKLPGVKVYMTRKDDRTLSLEDRNAYAVSKKADLFISIHANAATNRKMSGIETYYLNNATDEAAAKLARRENRSARKKLSDVEHILSTMLQNYDAAQSRLLAGDVQGSLIGRVGKRYSGVKNRSVRSAMFYVLVGAKCPAILVETSFISNPREEKRLLEPGYQEEIAKSIAIGVHKYIKASDKRIVAL